MNQTPPISSLIWNSPQRVTTGISILIPGLNLKSSILNPLAQELTSMGEETAVLSLSETNLPFTPPSTATSTAWLGQLRGAVAEARERAGTKPVTIVGYSLGALLALKFIDSQVEPRADRLLLIAPPTSLKPFSYIGSLLLPLLPRSYAIQSLAPENIRTANSTPVAHYDNLIELMNDVNQISATSPLATTPTLTIISERDEFTSARRVELWAHDRKFGLWETVIIQPTSKQCPRYDHFIVDEGSMGEPTWRMVRAKIEAFLTEH